MRKKLSTALKISIVAPLCAGVYSVFAHAISYIWSLTATFSPNPATIGPSGDATVTGPVAFGSNITFRSRQDGRRSTKSTKSENK